MFVITSNTNYIFLINSFKPFNFIPTMRRVAKEKKFKKREVEKKTEEKDAEAKVWNGFWFIFYLIICISPQFHYSWKLEGRRKFRRRRTSTSSSTKEEKTRLTQRGLNCANPKALNVFKNNLIILFVFFLGNLYSDSWSWHQKYFFVFSGFSVTENLTWRNKAHHHHSIFYRFSSHMMNSKISGEIMDDPPPLDTELVHFSPALMNSNFGVLIGRAFSSLFPTFQANYFTSFYSLNKISFFCSLNLSWK